MKRLVYILFVCGYLFSCKKDKKAIPDGTQSFSIPDDIKDYCFFKPGTFWVYEDSLTGVIDSMFVTDSYMGKDTITAQQNVGYTGIFDFFNVYIYSTNLGGEYLLWTDASFWQAPGMKDIPRVYIRNTRIISADNENILMFTHGYLNNNQMYSLGGGIIKYMGKATQNISGTETEAYYFHNTRDIAQYNVATTTFFVKDIGITKRIYYTNSNVNQISQAWILKRYLIVN